MFRRITKKCVVVVLVMVVGGAGVGRYSPSIAPGCALCSEPPASPASRRKRRHGVKDRPQSAGGYWASVLIFIKQPSEGNDYFWSSCRTAYISRSHLPHHHPTPPPRRMTSRLSVTPRVLIPRVTQPSDSAARLNHGPEFVAVLL